MYVFLQKESVVQPLVSQVLRSGTSIGANVEEAMGGASRKDFKAKLSIAYKEARETRYWLLLLKDSDVLDKKLADSMLNDCTEIIKILTSILNTLQSTQ